MPALSRLYRSRSKRRSSELAFRIGCHLTRTGQFNRFLVKAGGVTMQRNQLHRTLEGLGCAAEACCCTSKLPDNLSLIEHSWLHPPPDRPELGAVTGGVKAYQTKTAACRAYHLNIVSGAYHFTLIPLE